MARTRVAVFRASVVDVNDPTRQGRMRLQVPQVLGNEISAWAKPYTPPAEPPHPDGPLVADGRVHVTFEGGNQQYPMAFPLTRNDQPLSGLQLYPGMVLDSNDPMGQSRVNISVPAISENPLGWAPMCAFLTFSSARTIRVGSKVVVVFDRGDTNYPIVFATMP